MICCSTKSVASHLKFHSAAKRKSITFSLSLNIIFLFHCWWISKCLLNVIIITVCKDPIFPKITHIFTFYKFLCFIRAKLYNAMKALFDDTNLCNCATYTAVLFFPFIHQHFNKSATISKCLCNLSKLFGLEILSNAAQVLENLLELIDSERTLFNRLW